MNTQIIITPFDILITFLILAGLAVMVLTIIILIKFIKILGKFNKFIDETSKPLSDSVKFLPEIAENSSIATKNIAGITETAGDLIDGIGNVIGSNSTEDNGIFAKISFFTSLIQNIVTIVRSFINKDE